MLGKIFISKNRVKVVEELKQKYQNSKVFIKDEFKIDDAKEVIQEAYISETIQKYLILSADNFNIYAQNRLLKILEEPPQNITFFIVGSSKSIFLPTILSRMIIENLHDDKNEYHLDLDLTKLDLNDIFEFVKKNRFIQKEELKTLIQELLKRSVRVGIKLSEDDLDNFKIALELSSLNSKPYYLLTNLLLSIYGEKKKLRN